MLMNYAVASVPPKIFEKYPHLERRPRPLRLVRNRNVDHLSPREWEGELTAGSCDIHACYHEGVAQEKAVLAKYGCDMDFTTRFSQEGFDLMRPKGGKYPGLSKEVDRSLENAAAAVDAMGSESLAGSNTNLDARILTFNAHAALAAEQTVHAAQDAAAPPGGHSLWINLNEDGSKKAHKKTILRTFMDPTFDVKDGKSHDRLLRVRYFSIGGDSWDRTASTVYSKSTANDHLLKIHGLFAALICFDTSKVSLAILQCTGIKITNTHPITYLEAAPSAEISLPDSKYEVSGQILSLVPFDESSDPSIADISWAWVTEYVSFESTKAKKASGSDASARMRHLSVTLDGRLVLPLTSTDSRQVTLEEILKILPGEKDSEKTWVFSNTQLEALGAILCDRVKSEEIRLTVPTFGMHPLPKTAAGRERQNHVGKHIFLSQQGIEEPNNVTTVAKKYPCGFCGQEMSKTGCTIAIVKAALKSSAAKPCTNAPLGCSLCSETHWKYNMLEHLQERHPTWDKTMEKSDLTAFRAKLAISEEEENRLRPQTSQPAASSQTDTARTKRRLEDIAVTPSRARVFKVARPACGSQRKTLGDTSNHVVSQAQDADVFT
ncbi:hypothetical protein R3P38DRAFT_2786721 [Favolaschia claudopus]|uniref:Uncharacterized protein n=1 Tax=Favolaschia claudopus TaxID=2862362 RepID=A0AAW0ATJ3_9AGAR